MTDWDLILSFVEARVKVQYEHDLQHDKTHPTLKLLELQSLKQLGLWSSDKVNCLNFEPLKTLCFVKVSTTELEELE